jgi:hypothetical protein
MDLVLVLDKFYTLLFYPKFINTCPTFSKFFAPLATLFMTTVGLRVHHLKNVQSYGR